MATFTINIDKKNVVIFDADFLVLTYDFTDGRDLDTRTRVVTPEIGQNAVTDMVGWNVSQQFPSVDPIIQFGGDNTGVGLESILININTFKTSYPTDNELVIDLRSFWYNIIGDNNVSLKAVFYKGGDMVVDSPNFTFVNTTFTDKLEFTTSGKQIPGPINKLPEFEGYRLSTFTYNIINNTGTFDLNDITTPSIN